MNKRIDCIAFHEDGHDVAQTIEGIPCKYVTIKEDTEKDEHGLRSPGHIMIDKPKDDEYWNQFTFLNPIEFNVFFKDDFTKLARLIAEGKYRGRFNYRAAKSDFRQWVGTSLNQLPERLNSRYIDFMLEYTYQVLQDKNNWSNIKAVTLALENEETLNYKRVCEVIKQNQINPII